ncbi:MAG: lectin-like protein [Oligoflexales bacterium]
MKRVVSLCILALFAGCKKESGSEAMSHSEDSRKYFNWADDEPNDRDGNNCIVMTKNGEWETANCHDQHYYICENQLQLGYFTIETRRGSWYEHTEKCGGAYNFSYPKSSTDVKQVLQARLKAISYCWMEEDAQFWMNLTDQDLEGDFRSVSVQSRQNDPMPNCGQDQKFFSWDGGEGKNNTDDNCVLQHKAGKWRDIKCTGNQQNTFACKSTSNSSDWYIDESRGVWPEFRNKCQKEGYVFAAPQNSEEVDALNAAIKRSQTNNPNAGGVSDETWINLTDQGTEGKWRTLTGEAH